MVDFLQQLLASFVTLFVIIDPFSSVPVFATLTRKQSAAQRFESAKTAVVIAASALFAFMLVGPFLLDYLGISIQHFKIAGGIVLFIIGLEYVLKFTLPRDKDLKVGVEIVVIGTPLITGPGALTVSVILVGTVGYPIAIGAVILVMLATLLILLSTKFIMRFLGEIGSEVFSRIMGLLLASLAINFILTGLDALRVAAVR